MAMKVITGTIVVLFVIGVMVAGASWLIRSRYVPYVPVRQGDDQGLIYDPSMATADLADSMKRVLDQYNEPYVVKNGSLYITKHLYRDMDTVWNYTNKAIANKNAADDDDRHE